MISFIKRNLGAILYALLPFVLITPFDSFSASCCGGGSVAPSLVLGDYRTQLQGTVSRSTAIGDAPDQGVAVFRRANDRNVTTTYQLTGATLLSDRVQINAGIPIVTQSSPSRSVPSTTRWGDVRIGMNYEAIPEWSYSEWMPNAFLMVQMTFPTGQSIYESGMQTTTDITGGGFYKPSVAGFFYKQKGKYDFFFLPQVQYAFTRTFAGVDGDFTKVSPGWGGSTSFGAGVNPSGGNLRIGLLLQPALNQPRTVQTSAGTTRSSEQRYTDTGVNLSYLFPNHWTVIASYVDQTLLGPAKNATLSRTASISLQLKWLR